MITRTRHVLLSVGLLSAIASAQPKDAPACIAEGTTLFDAGNFKQAVIVLEKCSADLASWRLLALSYFELSYMEEAKSYLQKAIKQNPDDLDLKIRHANASAMNKEFKKAVEEFRVLHKAHPGNVLIRKGLAQALGWSRQYPESIELYRALIKDDPSDYESWIQIGVLTSWNKKFSAAIAEFTALIDSKPPADWELKARMLRAEVLSWQKKFDESILEYRDVLKLDAKLVDAYLGMGQVYEWQGKYKDAKKQYEGALAADPQSTAAKGRLNQLMWVK